MIVSFFQQQVLHVFVDAYDIPTVVKSWLFVVSGGPNRKLLFAKLRNNWNWKEFRK
jgi:hypothetical protein